MKPEFHVLGEAVDREQVVAAVQFLGEQFEGWLRDRPTTLAQGDILMIGHNFHKIVLDALIRRIEEAVEPERRATVRPILCQIALDTWTQGVTQLREESSGQAGTA